MKLDFAGRIQELEVLDTLWRKAGAQLLVLYGRRRVGKTALLTHWLHTRPERVLYWSAAPTSATAQLRSFSQAIYNFANPETPAPASFTYASWEQAWNQVASLARSQRLVFFLDEFTYLLQVEPGIAGLLQNLWDHTLSSTELFLCLSGSHLGMMKREFLSYQAPLYGRATAHLYLRPLPFGLTAQLFPKYTAVDRVAIYALFGGIPAYWELLDTELSISQNIRLQLLTSTHLMQAEPRLLLQDFIAEPHNYMAVLTAIANGARTPKEISNESGIPNVQVPKYLSVLSEAGFVERRIPVTERGATRSGRHHITDPYLRFYFRFLVSRLDQLALGIQDQALAEISRHLIDFIGTHTWEELCREWVLRASAQNMLPFLPDQVGSAWNRQAQVDVVGINWMQKTIILGECKWTLTPMECPVLTALVEKANQIIPSEGNWRVFFLGFSRSGWSSGAIAYQNEIDKHPVKGQNWQSVGMRLLDLVEVDRDMTAWSA
jgi:AAA+ ATPase superfamily predicted ATPase